MTRTARALFALLVLPSLVSIGCSSPSSYVRSRLADLADVVPMSFGVGWGLGAEAQATPLLQAGLGLTPVVANRFGYEDRIMYGSWEEYQAGFPWTWGVRSRVEVQAPPFDDPWYADSLRLHYRWQRLRDAPGGEGQQEADWEPNTQWWSRHPPVVRESFGALAWPQRRSWIEFRDERRAGRDPDPLELPGPSERASVWTMGAERRPAPRAWDLFEADLFVLFIGVRVGLRPVEFADFLAGIVFFDPLGDDLPAPTHIGPGGEGPVPTL
ncbi:MAG: hypothetical protein DHS20C15_20860 [Planctomycetota bacterium]|nr:MAG: hypothetical protein DHS20C15_20860 [Planctomycetota bacterium]